MRRVSRAACAAAVAVASSASIAQTRAALPEPFVYLSDIDSRIQQDMRYAGGNNFLGRPVKGYGAGQCILTRETALSLKKVQDALLKNNYSLKVYDCYRPAQGVRDFVTWSQDERDQKMKQQYYPDVDKSDLFDRGFISSRSMHSRGNTVDLTIVPANSTVPPFAEGSKLVACDKPAEQRLPDNSLDFGTGFDCFSSKSRTASSLIPETAQENRRMLVDAMAAEGFANYPKEWWHFGKRGAAMPEAYNFPISAPPAPQTVQETAKAPPAQDR